MFKENKRKLWKIWEKFLLKNMKGIFKKTLMKFLKGTSEAKFGGIYKEKLWKFYWEIPESRYSEGIF